MADNEKDEGSDLLEKIRASRRAHPTESDVTMGYRERLMAASQKTYHGKVEVAHRPLVERIHRGEAHEDQTQQCRESESKRSYSERLFANAKKTYLGK